MGNALRHVRGESQKNIVRFIEGLSGKYSRSGSKKIVTPNVEVISCEYTEDPHKATGTGFAPHWGSCRAAGSFKSREEHNG